MSRRWPASPAVLVEAFAAATARLRGIEHRKMFGYPAIFVNGNMAAGLIRDSMVLRLSTRDRERFLALSGAKPFIAMKGRVMKQWAMAPRTMPARQAELKRWLARSLAYARTLPPKARKKKC